LLEKESRFEQEVNYSDPALVEFTIKTHSSNEILFISFSYSAWISYIGKEFANWVMVLRH